MSIFVLCMLIFTSILVIFPLTDKAKATPYLKYTTGIYGSGSPNYLHETESLTIRGDYLYASSYYEHKLVIINQSNPLNLVVESTVSLSGTPRCANISPDGNWLYLMQDSNGGYLYVINVTDKSNPDIVGSYYFGSGYRGSVSISYVDSQKLCYTGNYITSGIRVIDVTNKVSPTLYKTISTDYPNHAIWCNDTRMVALSYSYSHSEICTYDISNPANVITLDYIANYNAYMDRGCQFSYNGGDYGYYACLGAYPSENGGGAFIIDLSNFCDINIVGEINSNSYPNFFYVSNAIPNADESLLFVTCCYPSLPDGVWVFNIADKSNPILIANFTQDDYANLQNPSPSGLKFINNLLYVSVENGITVFNLTQKLKPEKPSCVSPTNTQTDVPIFTSLKCHVIDNDNHRMSVSFYWGDNSLIQTVSNIDNNSNAQTSSLNLQPGTVYSWYAIANNSFSQNKSDSFTFTTESWSRTNWLYYKILPITNPYNNYQININVTKTSGGNVNCGGKCKNDFSDIRFVDIDSTTMIPYWIEKSVSGSYANIWVKLPGDITTDLKILMFYGNSGASGESNGTNVFLFFDDFSGSLSKWSGDTSYFSTSGGELTNTPTTTIRLINHDISVSNTIVRAKIKTIDTSSDIMWGLGYRIDASNRAFFARHDTTGAYTLIWGDGNTYWSDTSPKWTSDVYGEDQIIIKTTVANSIHSFNDITVTGVLDSGTQNNVPPNGISIISTGVATTGVQYMDWILQRMYLVTAPTWGTPSGEYGTNHAPNKPTCISPINNAINISINTKLKCHVIDIDNNALTVSFYWDNNSLIQTINSVANDSDVQTSSLNLGNKITYIWYAKSYDGIDLTQSDDFTFTTESKPLNHKPNQPILISPITGNNISIHTKLKCHVTDMDNDKMTVSFYWFNDSLIQTINNVNNDTDVETDDLSLDYNTAYVWKVIANDSILQNLSDTHGFTTLPNQAPLIVCVSPLNNTVNTSINVRLTVHVTDFENDSMSLAFYWYYPVNGLLISNVGFIENNTNVNIDLINLSYDTLYQWYVIVNSSNQTDSEYSNIFNFTTLLHNHAPDKPTCILPVDNSFGNSLDSKLKCHVSDNDNDNMTVQFYFLNPEVFFDYYLLETQYNVANNSDVETTYVLSHYSGMDYNFTYNWYVIANDSQLQKQSDNFTFTTKEYQSPSITCILPVDNSSDISISGTSLKVHVESIDDLNMTVSFYWGNDTFIENFGDIQNDTDINTSELLGLQYDTAYSWYAMAYDGIASAIQSDNFTFTTESEPLVNHRPSVTNYLPANTAIDVSISGTKLKCHVYDSDDDLLNVTFYDGLNNIIYNAQNQPDGQLVQTSDLTLSYDTEYLWYVVVNDSQLENNSDMWSFTTESEPYVPPENNAPDKAILISPENDSINISINTTLKVTVHDDDNDLMNVSFYLNGTLIEWFIDSSNGVIESSNLSLEYNTTYFWYVNCSDGEFTTKSDVWSFTTELEPEIAPPENNAPTIVDSIPRMIVGNGYGYACHELYLIWKHDSIDVNDLEIIFNDNDSIVISKYNYTDDSWDTSPSIITLNDYIRVKINDTDLPFKDTKIIRVPQIRFNLNDSDNDTLSIIVTSNSSGNWEIIYQNDDALSGWYMCDDDNMIEFNTIYYYNITVNDSYSETTQTFMFITTSTTPVIPPLTVTTDYTTILYILAILILLGIAIWLISKR